MEPIPSIADAKQALAEKRIDDAIGLLQEIDKQSAATAEVYSTLGAAYGHKRDFQQSLMCFEKALSLEPTAKAHFNLAAVQRAMGNNAAARASLQAALNIDPTYDRAKQILDQIDRAAPKPPPPAQPQSFIPPVQQQTQQPMAMQQPFQPTMPPPQYGGQPSPYGQRPGGMPVPGMFVPDRNWGKVIGGGLIVGITGLLLFAIWAIRLSLLLSPGAGIFLALLITAGLAKWFCSTGGDFETVHWVVAFLLGAFLVSYAMAKGYGIFAEGWYQTKKANSPF